MSTERPVGTVEVAGSTRILNCEPSRDTDSDWRLRHAADAGAPATAAEAAPAERDLRANWWTVEDQGSTSSCVGLGRRRLGPALAFRDSGVLADDTPVSPRFQWMAARETDELSSAPTTFIDSAGTSLKAPGTSPAGSVRFATPTFRSLPAGCTAARRPRSTPRRRSLESSPTSTWDVTSTTGAPGWPARGPILTRLDVDDTWYQASANDGRLDNYLPDTTRGGHAVALVARREAASSSANSWGTDWGDQGFAYAAAAYAEDAFTEAYGVVA